MACFDTVLASLVCVPGSDHQEVSLTIQVKDVRIDFHATHHANYQWGATFTWPSGKKTYGEYRTVGEAIESVKLTKKKESNHGKS